MGQQQSNENNFQRGGTRALQMLQTKSNLYNVNDNNEMSIKFSRNDLADTVSALSMGTARNLIGGTRGTYSDNNPHPMAPKKQTYMKYL